LLLRYPLSPFRCVSDSLRSFFVWLRFNSLLRVLCAPRSLPFTIHCVVWRVTLPRCTRSFALFRLVGFTLILRCVTFALPLLRLIALLRHSSTVVALLIYGRYCPFDSPRSARSLPALLPFSLDYILPCVAFTPNAFPLLLPRTAFSFRLFVAPRCRIWIAALRFAVSRLPRFVPRVTFTLVAVVCRSLFSLDRSHLPFAVVVRVPRVWLPFAVRFIAGHVVRSPFSLRFPVWFAFVLRYRLHILIWTLRAPPTFPDFCRYLTLRSFLRSLRFGLIPLPHSPPRLRCAGLRFHTFRLPAFTLFDSPRYTQLLIVGRLRVRVRVWFVYPRITFTVLPLLRVLFVRLFWILRSPVCVRAFCVYARLRYTLLRYVRGCCRLFRRYPVCLFHRFTDSFTTRRYVHCVLLRYVHFDCSPFYVIAVCSPPFTLNNSLRLLRYVLFVVYSPPLFSRFHVTYFTVIDRLRVVGRIWSLPVPRFTRCTLTFVVTVSVTLTFCVFVPPFAVTGFAFCLLRYVDRFHLLVFVVTLFLVKLFVVRFHSPLPFLRLLFRFPVCYSAFVC